MARPLYVIVAKGEDWGHEDRDECAELEVTGPFRSEEEAERYLSIRSVLRAAGARIVPLTNP